MNTEESNTVDLSSLGSFNFTPDWAKKDAGVSMGHVRSEHFDAGPRPERGGASERKGFGERKGGFGGAPRLRGGERFERPQPLNVEVKILPDPKALGTIIRKLQQDAHAYKLKELAYFFLDNPTSVLLKVSQKPVEGGAPAQPPVAFVQCKACGFASTREEDVIEHVLNAHLGDYYESKEIEVEPPKGNFNCVAKCGLSGVLLGPPNIHEFNATVREMIRTRYPQMSEAEYRSHIEMVRDADVIEAWRKGSTKRTVFTDRKPAGAASAEASEPPRMLTREQAEGELKRTILPTLLDRPKHLMIAADVAMASPVKPLVWAVRDALEAERRAPYGMCFALRGAFHHRKLHFFRVNDSRGQEFVTGVELKEFDAAHAIPELAAVAKFVAENPCCDKSELPPEGEKQLEWLVSTGHVVAFTNGVYSAVEKFPKYGPQWRKRKAAKAETVAAAPVSAATPVAEEAPAVAAATPVAEASIPQASAVEPADAAEPIESATPVEDGKAQANKVVEGEKKDETAAQLAE